ncbi:MAG TPA: sigma-54 dependent transcriptional regulator [Acidobacteriota bacterium]|nr:sigma-54 dependent transcriptional regulator [Acidobacteriota bacterium]
MPEPTILVVDDEKNILSSLKTALSLENFSVLLAGSGELALKRLEEEVVDLTLLDVKMPGIDGIETLRRIRDKWPQTPVVMMSGHGTIKTALEAIKLGAVDFVEKPLSTERLIVTIHNALKIETLKRENLNLRADLSDQLEIIGSSKALTEVLEKVRITAPAESRVMIRGENGTGKELIARTIHAASPRSTRPFVKVNCAAVPAELIESELFGHVKGAFTGAIAARKGKFELADGGTIFLDEIGDMKLEMQSKLLRVLQEGEFERVGGEKTIAVDVRVISATNRDLERLIADEAFRQDLYYRLAVIPITVPPLRHRLEDIPDLVRHFADRICEKNNRRRVVFSNEALDMLRMHPWPGNVRELQNIIERLVILGRDENINAQDVSSALPVSIQAGEMGLISPGKPLKDMVAEFEMMAIEKALKFNAGQVSNTARQLGLERSHLYKKMRAYGIKPR